MTSQADVLKYLNMAREYPSYFVSLVEKQLNSFINDTELPVSEDIIYETNEGKQAWVETRDFLMNQKSLTPFKIHEGLELAAFDHSKDLSQNGIFGHKGTDGSTFGERILRHCKKGPGSMAQIIGADFNISGRNIPEMTILGLIIDDGVKDRGHRKTIFNPEYKYIGCSSAVQGEKVITVFNMTENNLEKMSNSVNVNKENDNIKSSSKYSKSADSWSASVPFQDSTNFKNMTSGFGNKSTNDDHSFMKKTSQSKKMTEKRENSKIYFEEGCKIIETTTKFLYSDGTMQENVDKRTLYLEQ